MTPTSDDGTYVVTTKVMGAARTRRKHTLGRTRPATPEEAFLSIGDKLHEEAAEILRAPRDVEEYGDLLQVLMDFAELNGIEWSDVLASRSKKEARLGSYLPATLWIRNEEQAR